MKSETQEKLIAAGLLLLLILLILPMLLIARYDIPSVDDFSYRIIAEPAWNETHSVLKTLWAQVQNSVDLWYTWQGTAFGNWLMLSAIALFSKSFYYLTIYFTLIPMILSEIFAARVIFCKGLRLSASQAVIVSLPCIIYQVMLPPSACEGFYWMCGAILYTTVFALAVSTTAVMVLLLLDHRRFGVSVIAKEILLLLLSCMIGGCNYVTALTMLLILTCFTIYGWWRRHPHRVCYTVCTVAFLACFLLSVISPGAANRQSSAGEHLSAVSAILLSFREAWSYIRIWTLPQVWALMLVLFPVYLRLARRAKLSFRLPALVTLFSFCIYAAQFTPCLYALGIIGAYRVQNLYRFTLYILLLGNEFYWCGWLAHRLEVYIRPETGKKRIPCRQLLWAVLSFCIVLPVFLYWGGPTVSFTSAVLSLRRGQAAAYYQEYRERLTILEDESVQDAELMPFTNAPYLLFFGDIQEDPSAWENIATAEYYHKNTVSLRSE